MYLLWTKTHHDTKLSYITGDVKMESRSIRREEIMPLAHVRVTHSKTMQEDIWPQAS
jgi:hypothetical protein